VTQSTVRTPSRRDSRIPQVAKLSLSYVVLILLTAVFVVPVVWMFLTTFKTNAEATQSVPTWFPRDFSTVGFQTILNTTSQTPVLWWLFNSAFAAVAHVVLVLVTAAPAAYALARLDFRGRNVMFALIISTLFIPPIIFLMPSYLIVDYLRWIDTLLAVIVPTAAGAFGVFFLRQFFVSLPIELEEAARIDGANQFQVFMRIVLPNSKPALATLTVLSFLTNWNEFLWPVYVLFSPNRLTLPPGLSILQGNYSTDYPVVMAGGVIASIPVLIVFFMAQRYIIEGVSRSGLKG
jgi:multiple sugar transport system permease protein